MQFEVPYFNADPIGYDSLFIAWGAPSGNFDTMRLVRNSYGFPTTIFDGVTLNEGLNLSFLDTDLQPGNFYYYTLFVHSTSPDRWVVAGNIIGLVVEDHNHRGVMWDYTADYMKEADQLFWTDAEDRGPLQRFLMLFAYEADRIQTEMGTLARVTDINRVSGGLLPAFAEQLGVGYEPEIGMRQTRILVTNAIHLYKTKGTKPGIEGVATAYTGFGADAVVGRNLALDLNDANFEQSIGNWVGGTSTTLSRDNALSLPAGSTYYLRLTSSAAVDASASLGILGAIPITGGQAYTASIVSQALTIGRAVSVQINWYTGDGIYIISTFWGDGVVNGVGSWTRSFINGLAPSLAALATVNVRAVGTANGEVHAFDTMQFERTINRLTANQASVETNLDGISGSNPLGNPATITRDTSRFTKGTASVRCVTSSYGGISLSAVHMVAGVMYTLSADVFVEGTGTFPFRFYVTFGTTDFLLGDTLSRYKTVTRGSWQRLVQQISVGFTGTYDLYLRSDAATGGSTNLLTAEQSSFEGGTTGGHMTVVSGVTFANSSAQAFSGTRSLQVQNRNTAITTSTEAFVYSELITASPGTTYTFSAYVRSASACTLSMESQFDLVPGTVRTSGPSTVLAANTWTLLQVTATAPAGTVQLRANIRALSLAANQVIFVDNVRAEVGTGPGATFYSDGLQFEEGATASRWVSPGPTTWQPAREIQIYLLGNRENKVPNPSAEASTSGWAEGANTTLTRTSATHREGAAAFRLTAIAAGTISAFTARGIASMALGGTGTGSTWAQATGTWASATRTWTASAGSAPVETLSMPVIGGEWYSAQCGFRANTVGRATSITIAWYTINGVLITEPAGTQANDTPGTWARLATVTAQAPATAAFAALVVKVFGVAAGEIHDFDAVMLEQSRAVNGYFDGNSSPSSDFLWGGTAHLTRSFYYPRRDTKNYRLLQVMPEYIPAGASFSLKYGIDTPATSV